MENDVLAECLEAGVRIHLLVVHIIGLLTPTRDERSTFEDVLRTQREGNETVAVLTILDADDEVAAIDVELVAFDHIDAALVLEATQPDGTQQVLDEFRSLGIEREKWLAHARSLAG